MSKAVKSTDTREVTKFKDLAVGDFFKCDKFPGDFMKIELSETREVETGIGMMADDSASFGAFDHHDNQTILIADDTPVTPAHHVDITITY